MEIQLIFDETELAERVSIKLIKAMIDDEECVVGRWSVTRDGGLTRDGGRITVSADLSRKE